MHHIQANVRQWRPDRWDISYIFQSKHCKVVNIAGVNCRGREKKRLERSPDHLQHMLETIGIPRPVKLIFRSQCSHQYTTVNLGLPRQVKIGLLTASGLSTTSRSDKCPFTLDLIFQNSPLVSSLLHTSPGLRVYRFSIQRVFWTWLWF